MDLAPDRIGLPLAGVPDWAAIRGAIECARIHASDSRMSSSPQSSPPLLTRAFGVRFVGDRGRPRSPSAGSTFSAGLACEEFGRVG